MDVLLLTAAVRLADVEADRAPIPVSLRLIGAALTLRLGADVAYGLALLGGTYHPGQPVDLCFLASSACWGAAGLHRSMRALSEPQPSRPARLTRPRAALLLAVSLLGPTLLAVQALRGRQFPAWLLLGAVAAVFAMVLARFATLVGAEAARADTQERLLERVVQAGEDERSRVAAEIHEGPIQRLAGVAYTVELVRRRLARGQAASGRQLLETLERQLSSEIGSLRRLMTELRPPVLDEWGLEAALTQVAADFSRRTGIAAAVDARAAPRLDPSRETVLYRVAQEALANIARHAGARQVWISLSTVDQTARLAIHDDGVGFTVDRPGDLLDRHHFGLIGMRQRVEMVGGTLDVRSRPGQGTVVSAHLPMAVPGTRPSP
jgi:two-component system NarL family sensor kinase